MDSAEIEIERRRQEIKKEKYIDRKTETERQKDNNTET